MEINNGNGLRPADFKAIFEKFYNDNYPAYFSYVQWYIKDKTRAKEVLDRAMAKLWENIPRLGVAIINYHYGLKTVHNCCMDYFKTVNKFEISHSDPGIMTSAYEDIMVQKEAFAQLHVFLERLEPSLKETIQLLFLEEMDHQEVAAKMGVALPTVYARKNRALKILRQWYKNLLRLWVYITLLTLAFYKN